MEEYTPEQISRIAAERCPDCNVPMSYNKNVAGFVCESCKLCIPYATYKDYQAKNRERIDIHLDELEKAHANKN